MSILAVMKAKLGLSSTPANNFTFDASADNGTMKLARGNAGATTQDILIVDAAGKVSFPQGSSSDLPAQAGNSGKVLTTNGTVASWQSPSIPQMTALAVGSLSYIGVYAAVAAGVTFTADGTATYKHIDTAGNAAAVNVPNGQMWRVRSGTGAVAAGASVICQRVS